MNNKYLILAISVVLISGCSKKTEESAADSASVQEAQVVAHDTQNAKQAADQAVVDAATPANTTPATEQKPETILTTEVSDAEKARRMVREAK